jgi:hypothetical protein
MDDDSVALALKLGEDGRRLLEILGQRAALREFDRACAVDFAIELLQQRVDPGVVRDRLMRRYRLSRTSAYRVRETALTKLSQNAPCSGTRIADHRSAVPSTVNEPRTEA